MPDTDNRIVQISQARYIMFIQPLTNLVSYI